MTSTEIIIRIKKARKKWKLVVPKKRMVATNRWFAKPRWVEIELTYTQASKLGLVEPRTPAPDITSGASAGQRVARHAVADSDHTLPNTDPEPDGTSTRQSLVELDPTVEQPGWLLEPEQVDCASDEDLLDEDTEADDCSSRSKFPVAVASHRSDRAAPRAGAFLLIAPLALGCVAAAWFTLSGAATTVDVACALSEQSSPCTQTIVTGSIDKAEQLQAREPEPAAALATHASSEAIRSIEQFQLNASEIATIPTRHEDDSAKAGNRADNASERTGAGDGAAESDLLSAATTAKTSLLVEQNVPADRHDCRDLGAASESIHISFDYASAGLKQAILPALDAFAGSLRSCPSTRVIIEGHTDSDGSAAGNQSLSVRRAKAVLEHLVHAGVPSSQLAAIGFGQSRPYAPNVSTKNKRSNRRVALVVDVGR